MHILTNINLIKIRLEKCCLPFVRTKGTVLCNEIYILRFIMKTSKQTVCYMEIWNSELIPVFNIDLNKSQTVPDLGQMRPCAS
jgi:hypothetical protein